ncbi:hypothetical protein VX037_09950 [Gordonia sp. Z-3]|jgi:hypothetical protein|uniref:Uncharacterized protein n=2 Tax=Gordonia TaxID=2053 RepID=A0A9X3D589_9ACTN|nr:MULTISPECIES: hypothetical protein [Gordonia]MAU83223.1 hypothetical protein [Gordonia sp. (in: high G+C Gram-positive bacteria)]MAU83635.1 hypothetical protein [Gordonia sp. (in: high G+C Gram-positive bacteria)]MCF3939137.1 hypothetical protein [Gordonia tangerina]MCX2964960.1 hypothetical protein [Gordonia aquimaris]MED5801345.1 hypothetical protein [Gordonia sp. Z-3]
MEPVEINAGAWYLRALRADERISDVPALDDLGVPDPLGYTEVVARGWESENLFVWGICIPTTGETIAVIGLDVTHGQPTHYCGRARAGYDAALRAAGGPVTRFAAGVLDVALPHTVPDGLPGL